jgi:hypothetical protein
MVPLLIAAAELLAASIADTAVPEPVPVPASNGVAAIVAAARKVTNKAPVADGVAAIEPVALSAAAATQLADSVAATLPAATARAAPVDIAPAVPAKPTASTWKRKVEAIRLAAIEIGAVANVAAIALAFAAPDPVSGVVAFAV